MSWAFLEIFIPLVLALLLGFLIGWLVFKWRRRVIHASEWNRLTTNTQQAQADLAAVRAAYEEASNERKIASEQVSELTADIEAARSERDDQAQLATSTAQELAANQDELTRANAKLAELEAALDDASEQLAEGTERDSQLERLETELADANSRATELETAAAQAAEAANEVDVLKDKIAEQDRTIAQHKLELKDRSRLLEDHEAELTARGERIDALESGSATAALESERVTDAEARATEMHAALTAARTELDVSQGRIADFDARLATARADLDAAHARVSELEARALGEAGEATGHGAEVIGQLRVDLAERDRRIAALEAAAASMPGDPHSSLSAPADNEETADSVPELTAVGTAGADHLDDLKVINGIGPRMEELLNTLGISSWEQLAGLDDAEVAVVDNALEEFPGRIARDQWVDQAKDLVSRFPDIADRPTSATYLHRLDQD